MNKKDVANIINDIINAAKMDENIKCLIDHLKRGRGRTNDHSYIEEFQRNICQRLNDNKNGYDWVTEAKNLEREEDDSVDIMGTSDNNPPFIIEIDASRRDQVAKKLLSRIALWGLDKPIHYIALLYPDTQNEKVQSEKFVKYGNDILQKIKKSSSASGIYIDMKIEKNNNSEEKVVEYIGIELWNFNKMHFKIDDHSFSSMTECAKEAIRIICKKNSTSDYNDVKKIINDAQSNINKITYINDKVGKSRYSKLDKTNIFVYTQWHEFRPEWIEFKSICKELNINIITIGDSKPKQKSKSQG